MQYCNSAFPKESSYASAFDDFLIPDELQVSHQKQQIPQNPRFKQPVQSQNRTSPPVYQQQQYQSSSAVQQQPRYRPSSVVNQQIQQQPSPLQTQQKQEPQKPPTKHRSSGFGWFRSNKKNQDDSNSSNSNQNQNQRRSSFFRNDKQRSSTVDQQPIQDPESLQSLRQQQQPPPSLPLQQQPLIPSNRPSQPSVPPNQSIKQQLPLFQSNNPPPSQQINKNIVTKDYSSQSLNLRQPPKDSPSQSNSSELKSISQSLSLPVIELDNNSLLNSEKTSLHLKLPPLSERQQQQKHQPLPPNKGLELPTIDQADLDFEPFMLLDEKQQQQPNPFSDSALKPKPSLDQQQNSTLPTIYSFKQEQGHSMLNQTSTEPTTSLPTQRKQQDEPVPTFSVPIDSQVQQGQTVDQKSTASTSFPSARKNQHDEQEPASFNQYQNGTKLPLPAYQQQQNETLTLPPVQKHQNESNASPLIQQHQNEPIALPPVRQQQPSHAAAPFLVPELPKDEPIVSTSVHQQQPAQTLKSSPVTEKPQNEPIVLPPVEEQRTVQALVSSSVSENQNEQMPVSSVSQKQPNQIMEFPTVPEQDKKEPIASPLINQQQQVQETEPSLVPVQHKNEPVPLPPVHQTQHGQALTSSVLNQQHESASPLLQQKINQVAGPSLDEQQRQPGKSTISSSIYQQRPNEPTILPPAHQQRPNGPSSLPAQQQQSNQTRPFPPIHQRQPNQPMASPPVPQQQPSKGYGPPFPNMYQQQNQQRPFPPNIQQPRQNQQFPKQSPSQIQHQEVMNLETANGYNFDDIVDDEDDDEYPTYTSQKSVSRKTSRNLFSRPSSSLGFSKGGNFGNSSTTLSSQTNHYKSNSSFNSNTFNNDFDRRSSLRTMSMTSGRRSLFGWGRKKDVRDDYNGDDDDFDGFSMVNEPRFEPPVSRPRQNHSNFDNGPDGIDELESVLGGSRYPGAKPKLVQTINNNINNTGRMNNHHGGLKKENMDDRVEGAVEIGMKQLTSLRDRDRYGGVDKKPDTPYVDSNEGRTMSLTMTNTSFDTTPIIPVLTTSLTNGVSEKGNKYRQRVASNQLKMLKEEVGAGRRSDTMASVRQASTGPMPLGNMGSMGSVDFMSPQSRIPANPMHQNQGMMRRAVGRFNTHTLPNGSRSMTMTGYPQSSLGPSGFHDPCGPNRPGRGPRVSSLINTNTRSAGIMHPEPPSATIKKECQQIQQHPVTEE